MPAAISSSLSRMTSSSRSRHMAKVSRLSRPMPPPSESASVGNSSTATGRPASRLAFIAAPRAIETPMTFVAGADALDGRGDARGEPAAGELAPGRARHPGPARSSPVRACLARRRWRDGRRAAASPALPAPTSRSTSCCASSWLLPTMRTSAPSRRISSTLLSGTSRDMQITARMPSSFAAWASARP